MKKLISILVCSLAALSVLVSCEPKKTPDGKCELTVFTIPASLNAEVAADIVGAIDASAKTITLVIPTSVTSTRFIPVFEATEYDVVEIGGTTLTSAETAVNITNGTQVAVKDEISAMNTTYTVAVKQNDDTAELTAVSFKKADNEALTEDVAPEAIAPEMVVRVPGAAFKQELTMTVAAGFNDAIKVNNTAVESGASIKVDTSFPIDIAVTDEIAGKTVRYVVKVGKILEVVVTPLGSYKEGSMVDFTMTLSPLDNLPYFAYVRKVDGDGYNGVSVAKWNGSAFSLVGATAIANASARSASKAKVAFSKDGALYAFYLGGDVASKPTVKKLDSDWTLVGTAGITPQNNNTSYPYPFFVHPASGKPSFFWCGNTKNQASYRTINFCNFGGESWATNVVTGTVPAYGSGSTASSGMYYTSSAVVTDSKVFIGSSFNEFGYYVHEVAGDGTLTTIVNDYVPAGEKCGLPGNVQLAAGPDGQLYLLGAVWTANVMQIYSVDQSAKTLKAYGAGIPVEISSNGSVTEGCAFGINPVTGLTVAAYGKKNAAPVIACLDDNLQWSNFAVELPVATDTVFQVAFDKAGNGYIAFLTAEGITLFKVGLEADILPE